MKMPNGYGTVYKLSGKRRKPFIARKTTGWTVDEETQKSKQIYVTIGYFATRPEALQALAEYNDNPYDINMSRITFAEIYQKWYDETFDEDSNRSTIRNYDTAYKHCSSLYKMKMSDIRPHQMQKVIDESGASYNQQQRILTLFNKLYEWCVNHDCIKKNYAEQVRVKAKYQQQNVKTIFRSEEIDLLWNSVNKNEYIKIILILIYSGVRISELLDLQIEDVNLEEQWFYVRDSKTDAGIRIVPIADKVLPYWKEFISKSKCSYAIPSVIGQHLSYDNFKMRYWKPMMEELKLNHTIHETRHTFITMMATANVNQTMIKTIVGHKSIMSLTEKVYTHIDVRELLKAVNKI